MFNQVGLQHFIQGQPDLSIQIAALYFDGGAGVGVIEINLKQAVFLKEGIISIGGRVGETQFAEILFEDKFYFTTLFVLGIPNLFYVVSVGFNAVQYLLQLRLSRLGFNYIIKWIVHLSNSHIH